MPGFDLDFWDYATFATAFLPGGAVPCTPMRRRERT